MKTSLLVFSSCLVALTLLAWGISFVRAHFFHLGYPFSTQLYKPTERFTDLTFMGDTVRNLSRGGADVVRHGPIFNYPAPALWVDAFFILLFPHPARAITAFTFGAGLIALVVLRIALRGSGLSGWWTTLPLLVAGLCSYPFAFLLDRGNIEGVVWFFTFLGLIFFIRKQHLASALFFAAAICIKPFPAFFVFLFLNRRRYWEIAAAAVAVCGAVLVALKAIGPTLAAAYGAVQGGVHRYLVEYVAAFNDSEINFDHSWFSWVKDAVRLLLGWPPGFPQFNALHHDLAIAYIVWVPVSTMIVLGCVIRFRRKPLLNQLFAIVLLMLLVPPVSYDYTLITLYLPWGAFMIFLIHDVGAGRVKFSLSKCLWILIPSAIVMTPQSYLTLSKSGFGGQVKALALTVLLIAISRIDMPSSLFGEITGDGRH